MLTIAHSARSLRYPQGVAAPPKLAILIYPALSTLAKLRMLNALILSWTPHYLRVNRGSLKEPHIMRVSW